MRRLDWLSVSIAGIALCCSAAFGRTLTFDDVPSGTVLRYSFYRADYRVSFDPAFQATDHNQSVWGPPHSGSNVLTWRGDPGLGLGATVLFGYYTPSIVDPDDIVSVGAYFSTQAGAMVTMTAYRGNPAVPVTSAVIGAPGESWDNRYVEISSPDAPFYMLEFQGVNSPADLLSFCADDMTIVPVPEPSSLAALGLAVAAVGAGLVRRRRG